MREGSFTPTPSLTDLVEIERMLREILRVMDRFAIDGPSLHVSLALDRFVAEFMPRA